MLMWFPGQVTNLRYLRNDSLSQTLPYKVKVGLVATDGGLLQCEMSRSIMGRPPLLSQLLILATRADIIVTVVDASLQLDRGDDDPHRRGLESRWIDFLLAIRVSSAPNGHLNGSLISSFQKCFVIDCICDGICRESVDG